MTADVTPELRVLGAWTSKGSVYRLARAGQLRGAVKMGGATS